MAMQNVFLVGLMGAGKTTIGRILARKLGLRFIDSDHEIEARTGASIPWIFEIEGEQSFRRREADVIRELTAQQGIVLATGGGAILNADSRAFLQSRGTVVYLRASVNSILARTAHDKNRPLLQTADPRKKLEELMAQRDPLYLQTADIVIDTGRPNVQSMVQTILTQLDALACQAAPDCVTRAEPSMNEHTTILLNVDLGERSYPISIGPALLDDGALLARHVGGGKVAIVSNSTVAPLYLERVERGLRGAGKQVISIVLPDGEEHKNWSSLMLIFDALLAAKADRKTTLLALGGGVIGDLTGYAAASYMRGIDFIQVPTTLLSQVDSSVGGKTGINHPLGKNMVGAFYQPNVVLIDTATLNTLPPRELSAGLAEVIKYGLICDEPFLTWLEEHVDALRALDQVALTEAISRSCAAKALVVNADERESGVRATLNLGHTFGHAIETHMGYGVWLHGEGVAAGTVMALEMSQRLGWISAQERDRGIRLFQRAGLPVIPPQEMTEADFLEHMAIDKKVIDGRLRLVLLRHMGEAVVTDDYPKEILQATLGADYRALAQLKG